MLVDNFYTYTTPEKRPGNKNIFLFTVTGYEEYKDIPVQTEILFNL